MSILQKQRAMRYGVIGIFVFALAISSCGKGEQLPMGSDLLAFNKEQWINQQVDTSDTPTLRQKMLADLVNNILPEMAMKQVIELLGTPDSENSDELTYMTGPERTEYVIPIDSEYFVIHFDKNGVFESYSLFTS